MPDGSQGPDFDPTLAIHGIGKLLDCIPIVCTVYMASEHGTFSAVYSIVQHSNKDDADQVSDTPEQVKALGASVPCGDCTDGVELVGAPEYVSDSVAHTCQ